jgi:hypothetical protein
LKLPEAVLVAGNVPIGLYESVFDVAGPAKFLKGWRYVGFSPWGGGPPNGTDQAAMANLRNGCPPCTSAGTVVQGPLYGIVFFNGAMTFRQIDEIANNMTCPQYVKPFSGPPEPQPEEGGVKPNTAPPSSPGVTVPRSTPPGTPQPNPGPTSMRAPGTYTRPVDAGVRQTSSTPRRPTPRVATTVGTGTSPKAVDRKALDALEAEVFRSLNYTPPTGANGATPASMARPLPVPDLSPAMPIR